MAPSKRGTSFAFCTLCSVDVSVAGGGVHEVKRHCESAKHKRFFEGVSVQPNISCVMARTSKGFELEKVMKAELYFARFVAEHNLSFTTADHFTKLCKVMFPDSKIAESFSCARTKTTALITHALAPSADEAVVSACQKQPFSILCDGGNDNFQKKYFGILVRLWDDSRCEVIVRFLDCPVCNIATGESLFQALETTLQSQSIPWKNVIGFASDSASVMVGKRNSVLSRVRECQPDVFSLGCMCHLAALCATAALKKLPLSIDGLLIDIFYHFKHSSKRCEEFAGVLQDFDGIAPLSVIKHCSTRWLSLEKAVKRLITLWPALRAYFDRERGSNDRARRVAESLMDVDTKLWCHFIAYALKPLNSFNTALQTSASKIGTLQHDISQLLRSYLGNFIRPECLVDLPVDAVTQFDFDQPDMQVCDTELAIGTATHCWRKKTALRELSVKWHFLLVFASFIRK